MKGLMAALGVTRAWASPGLVLVAIALALLDLTVVAQRWATLQPSPSVPVRPAAVTVAAENCSPTLAPELSDMIGHD